MIRMEIGEKTEITVTEPYLYQGYSVQSHGKSKLITINALSLKQPCSELKWLFGERLKNRTMTNQWVETMVKISALNMLTELASVYFS